MTNSRIYDGAIQAAADKSTLHKEDGFQYPKDSIGSIVNMTLNGIILAESKLTHIENDFYSNCILIKFENGKIEKIPTVKGIVEFDEDMEFPIVYFDYRDKKRNDKFLNEKDDKKSMEELDFKLNHGGIKKLKFVNLGRYDQAIIAFEILDNTKAKIE